MLDCSGAGGGIPGIGDAAAPVMGIGEFDCLGSADDGWL